MSVEIEEYLSFSHKINELISAHMLGLNLTVKDYKFIYLWDEIIKDNVNLRSFNFERSARRSISGMIIKDEYAGFCNRLSEQPGVTYISYEESNEKSGFYAEKGATITVGYFEKSDN